MWRGGVVRLTDILRPETVTCSTRARRGNLRHTGTDAPTVYRMPAHTAGQEIRRLAVPQTTIALPAPRSEARLRRQFDLTRAAPSATAIAGAIIAGVGLIAAFMMAVLVLGAFLRGASLSGAILIKTAVVEAGLIAGILVGAFLTRE
jgi:hypothetical protein